MAIERILGTDTGKVAFEKTDRNFVGLEGQINNLAPIDVATIDANSIYKSGFYRVLASAVNVPGAPGILRHETWDGYFAYQELVLYASSLYKRYMRIKINNVWGDWENVVTNKQPSWITATLQNGWTGDLRYRKNAIGQLELAGQITPGTMALQTVVTTLPSGFRPKYWTAVLTHKGNGVQFTGFNLGTDGSLRILKPADTTLTAGDTVSFNAVIAILD